jgi:hypothetical protein
MIVSAISGIVCKNERRRSLLPILFSLCEHGIWNDKRWLAVLRAYLSFLRFARALER